MNKTAPNGFCPQVFSVAVWDNNIDLDEETVSGSGTTHHTNGILVQPSVSEFDQQACFFKSKKIPEKDPCRAHTYSSLSTYIPRGS